MHTHAEHDPAEQRRPRRRRTPTSARWLLGGVVVPLAVATLVGLFLLWPSDGAPRDLAGFRANLAHATVVGLQPCTDPLPQCSVARVEVTSGAGAPREAVAALPYGEQAPTVSVGDDVLLSFEPNAPPQDRYVFQDFDRTDPLLILLLIFVAAVLLLSRWRGLGSLIGLGFTLVLLVTFTLPAVMEGSPALAVAIVTAATSMLVTLYWSHGVDVRTSVAVVGTLLALVLIGVLGSVFTDLGQFTGLADEGSQYIATVAGQVDLSGLLLAGLVIGALGVLDDVTVTQVWAVFELADADPSSSRRTLFRRGMRIGRSHAASTINTLALAYVGATLPLLLVFSAIELPFGAAVSQELVAQEVVRGLVGGLGILAAIPITTAFAAVIATQGRTRPAQTPEERQPA